MAVKQVWLNIPVKNINKSREFFTKLGFSFHKRDEGSEQMAGLIIGENNSMIMLCQEDLFKGFVQGELADTNKGAEILISFDAESRNEVDRLANLAVEAGGNLFGKPSEIDGWMYGCGFSDLDGHKWNILYMDMSKME